MLIPECPLGLEVVDHPDEVPVTVLAEERRPDVGCVELGWNMADGDFTLFYYLTNAEEP